MPMRGPPKNTSEWAAVGSQSEVWMLIRELLISETIRKVKGGYRLVSKKTGKNLGTYPTRTGAEKREQQVQYFKHKK